MLALALTWRAKSSFNISLSIRIYTENNTKLKGEGVMNEFKKVKVSRLAATLEKAAANSSAELARVEGKKKPSTERNSFLTEASKPQSRKDLIDVGSAAKPILNCFIQTDDHKFTLS